MKKNRLSLLNFVFDIYRTCLASLAHRTIQAKTLVILAWFFAAWLGLTGVAHAASTVVRTEQAQVELVAHAPQGLTPGARAWLGIIIEHKPDWHTYWKNPGDSGLPTELQWQLPPGLSVGPILWPLPKKIPIAPLANYGFEGRTLLAVPLKVGTDFKPDFLTGKTKIGLQATWLICRRECIPQSGNFSLELPAGASTVRDAGFFEALLKDQPGRVAGQQKGEVLRNEKSASGPSFLRLAINGLPAAWRGQRLEAFPETTGIFETAATAQSAPQRWEGSTWVVDLAISPYRQAAPKRIPILIVNRIAGTGLVAQAQIAQGWTPKAETTNGQSANRPAGENGQGVGVANAQGQSDSPPHSASDGPNDSAGDSASDGAITQDQSPDSQEQGAFGLGGQSTGGASSGLANSKTASPVLQTGQVWSASFLLSLIAALVGGLLLNLMPCVFPVLTIKILSFAQAAPVKDGRTLRNQHLRGGLLYGLGVVVSFALLAGLLLALRAAGQALGWGFQLQSPWMIAALMVFFLLIALNLLGVFEFKSVLPSALAAWRAQNPSVDHFLSGVLAVLVASPCTAPFMGAALGAALSYPAWAALSVFIALGLGMALPYVLLAAFPAWLRFLPKPGLWMHRFKQWMALPILLTVAWLAWVLYQQVAPPPKVETAPQALSASGEWQAWSPERERALLEAGKVVFVDYTAAWCITCQVNKRTTLDTREVETKFKEKNVLLLRADWTRYDPEITESLRKLGRTGIPVYVLYVPGKAPQLFTEFLSKETLLSALASL